MPNPSRDLRQLGLTVGGMAHALGFIGTRLGLAIVFVGVMAPIALGLRIVGKDPLDRRRDRRRPTYWRTREAAKADRLTRLY
jgi:hypothetical protein